VKTLRSLVGLYHLRLLWIELQTLKPDENGIVTFNFQRFKRVHDIADSAIAPEA
jgi:hypothetical protein